MKGKAILLVIVILGIIGAIAYIESTKPDFSEEPAPVIVPGATTPSAPALDDMALEEKRANYLAAPEIIPTGEWLNTEPLSIAGLRGKVVLVDFWTYSCINCIRTLPYLKDWHAKYADAGLVILGVHTPEFKFEQDIENLKKAVAKYEIEYPVVQDNEYRTWRAYKNRFWPRKYLVDIDGFIRYDHIGEGAYAETEQVIQELLKEKVERMGETMDVQKPITAPEGAQSVDYQKVGTPELYFGYTFRRHDGGNTEGYAAETAVTYAEPVEKAANIPYVVGTWFNDRDFMRLESATGTVHLNYDAKTVNIVAGAEPGSTIEVYVDGTLTQTLAIDEERLYEVIAGDAYGQHRLELRISGSGFRIYTFTFG